METGAQPPKQSGRIMGIDLGHVRIGVAISDASGILATPFSVIKRSAQDRETMAEIERIAIENGVTRIVVGIPNSLSNEQSLASDAAKAFVVKLREHSSLIIESFDERFTTVQAAQKLRATGHDSRSMKSKIDASAAAEILQQYLDHHGSK